MITDFKTYNIIYLNAEDVSPDKLNLDLLLKDEINGFVINDFLNEEELKNILKSFRSLPDSVLVNINKGFNSYPMSFAQFEQMLSAKKITEKDYFDFSVNYCNSFKSNFGVDVFSKLTELFSKINNAPNLSFAPHQDFNAHYIPFTFRELFAGEGTLKAHCENLFLFEFPGFFNRINTFSKPDNQLSFFIVLQSPGEGGALTLFDIKWNDKQKRPNDDEIILEDGRKLTFNDEQNLQRDSISASAGSLVVFNGGKIWHRVETVTQSPSRITLGGFLSFSHDQTKLYSWS